MGDYESLNTPDRVVPDEVLERAATRHILRRYETGLDTAEQTRTILQVLGLADEPAPPVDRKRRAAQQRSARRSAQRAAARAERDTGNTREESCDDRP